MYICIYVYMYIYIPYLYPFRSLARAATATVVFRRRHRRIEFVQRATCSFTEANALRSGPELTTEQGTEFQKFAERSAHGVTDLEFYSPPVLPVL